LFSLFEQKYLYYFYSVLPIAAKKSPMNQRFPKEERLKSLKKIQSVITNGRVMRFGCIKVHWMLIPIEDEFTNNASSLLKAGFSVPKKKINHAFGRNLIRRKMKEIFRLHKEFLYKYIPKEKQLLMFFIYQSNQNIDYKVIEDNLLKTLRKIQENTTRNKNTNP
jgi:ribonuclease P protein component